MGLLKVVRRDKGMARELAQCVADCRPYRLLDMKVFLTRRCNLRCLMCGAWANDADEYIRQDGHDELSAEEIKRAVTQARALGLVSLKLFGGEPMLRRDVEEIVAHAAGMGIRCSLTTNGTMLSQERAQALVEAGLAELDLSLDASDPALHDEIRGCPGTWARAVHGLQSDSGGRLSGGIDSLYLYGTGEQDMENATRRRYADRLQVGCCFKPWYYMVIRENGDVGERSTLRRGVLSSATRSSTLWAA